MTPLPLVTVVECPTNIKPASIAPNKSDLSVISITVPSQGTPTLLAHSILRALGKNASVNGAARHSIDDIDLASIWLTAHRTRLLVVLSAQLLTTEQVRRLIDMIAPSTARVVLLTDPGDNGKTLAKVTTHGALHMSLADLQTELAALQEAVQGSLETSPDSEASRQDDAEIADIVVPRTEFPEFRSACRALFTDDQFTIIDTAYCEGFVLGQKHVAEHAGDASERGLVDLLHTELTSTLSRDLTIATLRGVQMALLIDGWLLRIRLDQLLARLDRTRPLSATTTEWCRLRAYRDTVRAATTALYLANTPLSRMLTVTIHDIAKLLADDEAATDRGLPPEAIPYLRAHLITRAWTQADPTSPFLPSDERRMRTDLSQASSDLGLNLGFGKLVARENASLDWVYKVGFQLQDLR